MAQVQLDMSPPLVHAPRRVVFHVEGDVFGGVESHLCALLRHLDRCRYQPLVLCRNVPELVAALGDLDVEVRVLDPVRSKADVGGWWGVIRAVGASGAPRDPRDIRSAR